MMPLFAASLCVGIILFCIIYLVAWFAIRNRPIKLGERKIK
jgi:hypothetical protein